jgi:phosphate transport system substrate-binding protein
VTRFAVSSALMVLLLSFLFATACVVTPTPRATTRIRLVGSDSMLWIARALTNTYTQAHPEVTFVTEASNSESGLHAASTLSQTIGMVSRTLKPGELNGARAVVVARDGIAIIVNPKNPINAIMRSQITQVFSGEVLAWPTGALAGQSILVVSREEGSGTRNAFETMAMNSTRVTLTGIVMPSEAAVVDYVAQHPEAIGYVSMGGLTAQVRAMTIDDVGLSTQTVESQQYPFVRTLTFVIPAEPSVTLQSFIDYALSSDGQAIIGQRYGRAP